MCGEIHKEFPIELHINDDMLLESLAVHIASQYADKLRSKLAPDRTVPAHSIPQPLSVDRMGHYRTVRYVRWNCGGENGVNLHIDKTYGVELSASYAVTTVVVRMVRFDCFIRRVTMHGHVSYPLAVRSSS